MADEFERQETFSNRSEPIFNPQRLPEKYLTMQTRIRRPTEKGLQNQIELKQKLLASKKTQATKHMRQVLLNIGRTNNANFWKQEYSKAQVQWAEFGDLYLELKELITDDEQINHIERIQNHFQNEWTNFKDAVTSEIEMTKLIMLENASKSSRRSRRSKHSTSEFSCSGSSNSEVEKRSLQKQSECIKVEIKLAEEEKRLRMSKLEQEEELSILKLKKQLAQNETKLAACTKEGEYCLTEDGLNSLPAENKQKDVNDYVRNHELNPSAKPWFQSEGNQPFERQDSIGGSLDKIASTLEVCTSNIAKTNSRLVEASLKQAKATDQLAISSQMPKISVPVFTGDPLEYPIWNKTFYALVDSKQMDVQSKMNLLSQYVSGKPKQIVDYYILIGINEAYHKARQLLHERYGNQNVVSTAFISKLDSWPKINPRDPNSIRVFSDFLLKVVAAKKTIQSLDVLDFAKENVKLLEKLPYSLQSKWRDQVTFWKSREGPDRYPPFTRFAVFVKEAADNACIPELESMYKPKQELESTKPGKKFAVNTFTTSVSDKEDPTVNAKDVKSENSKGNSESKRKCLFCKENHTLDMCQKFTEKPLKEKKSFFFTNYLCYGCGVSSNHKIKDCGYKKSCKVCSGRHLTCFHKEPTSQHERVTANCINVCGETDESTEYSMIVPVWVRPKNQPDKEILQCAVLDDQSNVAFISQALCDKLQVKGPQTQLVLSTVQEQNVLIESNRVSEIEVLDYHREECIELPPMFTRETVPGSHHQIPKAAVDSKWSHLQSVADKLMPCESDIEISLLIGNNCPRAIRPREIVVGGEDDPYGQKSLLGWGVIGRICKSQNDGGMQQGYCNKMLVDERSSKFVFPTTVKEILFPEKILAILESDFNEGGKKGKSYSVQDERFVRILEANIKKTPNGHYEMPLPLKSDDINFPNNRPLVEKRLWQLSRRFTSNKRFHDDYQAFMANVLDECAEKVPEDELGLRGKLINYVPHTGVYHPKKKKIRVVFDCSAQYGGVSLNQQLLQGPDLINDLVGILLRFREEPVAFVADIKGMFHQFYVTEQHRNLLRFLWWKEGDPKKELVEYRMKVHLFGATNSPGCANFGLKRAADDGEQELGKEAANFVRRDFYVDDGLKSVETSEEAVSLIKNSQAICAKAGLKLHKIMSNRRDVLEAVPKEDRAEVARNIDLKIDPLPTERVLGVSWCVENDSFNFKIEFNDRPCTRRGILSTVSSIYDPLGFAAPVVLKGKQILQQLCREKFDWDSPVSEELRVIWEKWRQEIMDLEKVEIKRCYKPENFGRIKHAELHHFSDASQYGYGQSSYLRLVSECGKVSCSFVIGKARVVPLKKLTIPRLELTAATVSAKMSEFVRSEISYQNVKEFFWTDSKVVLGYIKNESRRFHTYVANRVQQIRNVTDPDSWFYIESNENPADVASRGISAKELSHSSWFCPEFLKKDGLFTVDKNVTYKLAEDDLEVKTGTVLKSAVFKPSSFLEISRLEHISDWKSARRAIALCIELKGKLKSKSHRSSNEQQDKGNQSSKMQISLEKLEAAEKVILKGVQHEAFSKEYEVLRVVSKPGEELSRDQAGKRKDEMKKTSSLYRLDPFLDGDGILRVGGRIKRANVPLELKNPVILPRKGHVTEMIIRYYHNKVSHMGRGITHNEIRQRGYWIIGGSSAVSHVISRCVERKRKRGHLLNQKMEDLPQDRLEEVPPFTYCGVDFFGPFAIKEKRSIVKRYGVIFTCLGSRGVHLETANSLTTSSFINALSRFLNRRGPVRNIRSDQGTNFVGASNELKNALKEMDEEKISAYLHENSCEWIPFQFNVPHASHMGGVWERQIRTVREAIQSTLMKAGDQLDDEAFRTFITEAENIINSRPLSVSNLCSPDAPEPLTPNHLLTMKSKIVLPPPGNFQREDLYCRKQWRRVQFLTNEFWSRWRQEFLQNLQTRQKWIHPKRNVKINDIVISKEDSGIRNQWPLARVYEVYPSEDGQVRKCKILMGDKSLDNHGKRQSKPVYLQRPVHKLVLLLAAGDQEEQKLKE